MSRNVLAYTNDELLDILTDMAYGTYAFVNFRNAIRDIRRGEDRMVYKNVWTDAELRDVIYRHADVDDYYGE